jgi:hypothetical protein
VNSASPTSDECAAAVQCSTKEYCDAGLKKCLPLASFFDFCYGNAQNPSDDQGTTFFASTKHCGSCNRTAGGALIVDNKCKAYSQDACGGGLACPASQLCWKGKCICASTTSFDWTPYTDFDPDRDNKRNTFVHVPSGCDKVALQTIPFGFRDRVFRYVMGFADCITLANPTVTRFTKGQFGNETFRNQFCQNTPGNCTSTYCTALFQNATGSDRNSFCGQVDAYAGQLKRCAQLATQGSSTSPDITCSNLYQLTEPGSISFTSPMNYIELYAFLGCQIQHDDMLVVFGGPKVPLSLQYAMQTTQLLLGAGTPLRASTAIQISVIFTVMLVSGLIFS